MKTPEQKRKDLRDMLNSKELTFVMEAHDGMSAKIVEEVGFKAIWASGLSVSTCLGYRDNNELSFSQVADHCYHMSRCTNLPVIVDCDTMYGDFNTARIATALFERAGVAALIIEDKVFPKKNSFLNNGKKALADPDEFALKIKAIQETKTDPNLIVVARVESFLVGNGVDDAIMRATKYVEIGGADAVLIHSKKPTSEEIDAFMERWNNKAPVFIVPTKYYTTPTQHFRDIGINTVIWANHNMRTAIPAMRETSRRIFEDESLMGVEDKLITVSDVFKFQGNDELTEAEKKYLPKNSSKANVIILGAAEMEDGTPKTEVEVNGKTVLQHQVDTFKSMGITDIRSVYCRPAGVKVEGGKEISTSDTGIGYVSTTYKNTKELDSLRLLSNHIKKHTIISYGDLIFRKYIVQELLDSEFDMTIVADTNLKTNSSYNEFIQTNKPYNNSMFNQKDVVVTDVTTSAADDITSGVFIGLMTINNTQLAESIKKYLETCDTSKERMIEVIKLALNGGYSVGVRFIGSDSWVDVNGYQDVAKANEIK